MQRKQRLRGKVILVVIYLTLIESALSLKENGLHIRLTEHSDQQGMMSHSNDVNFHVQKREIERRLSSCPEDCKCEVVENENKVVDCFNSRLIDIPQNLPGDVVTLNMSRNVIQVVKQGMLDNLRDISSLDLSHNKITEIQQNALKDLTKLRFLDLSYNKLKNISLDDLRQSSMFLEVLKISSTEIRQIPELYDAEDIYMTKLTHLSMAKNYFTSIPPLHIPPSVTHLDISCLNIRTLKNSGLSGLDLLEELTIRGCSTPKGRLKAVEVRALATSVRLKRLDLSNNDINIVPVGLPRSIEYLDLSGNQINTIKRSECATERDMQNRLYVNANNEYDQYGDGRLTRPVGSALSVLSNLKELDLSGNPISSLCMDEFVNMENLRVLNMSDCRIYSFHAHTFVYTRSLQVLDLSSNQMKRFQTDDLSMLEELYLQGNLLENVRNLDNRKIPALKKADFSGNPWRCNCEIKPLVRLLAFSKAKFVNLHTYSVYYACSMPLKLKGKPLMTLNIDTDVECDAEGGISVWAIAAPASLVFLVVVISIVIWISRCRDAKKRRELRESRGEPVDEEPCCCFCTCCCKDRQDNYGKEIPDTRRNFNYPNDTLVRRNALLNDAAILCHEKDQKWILNKMIPEVHKYRDEQNPYAGKDKVSPNRLSMNVFTIGENIKMERLSKCIDSNRKIVLTITHNFMDQETCILVLNVIRERMVRDPKDSVILLILDAISWSTMPQCLQLLMVEKTFVQYPQDARGRQEYYFWENICSHMYSKSLRSLLPPVPEEGENLAFESEYNGKSQIEMPIISQSAGSGGSEEIFPPMRPAGWNTGGRNMRGLTMSGHGSGWMSPEREAKLKRLGLHKDGHLMDDTYAGIAEARNLGQEQKRNYQEGIHSNLPMPHKESLKRRNNEDISSVHRDIDDLYSTKSSSASRPQSSGRIRSLLPANAEDDESIYSEDEDIAAQMIKAPERPRSNARNPRLHSQGNMEDFHDPLASTHSQISPEHLHGTDMDYAKNTPEQTEVVEQAAIESGDVNGAGTTAADSSDDDEKTKKKKKKNKKKNKKKSKKEK